MPNSLKCRLKNLVRNGLLREKDLEKIIIIPPNATNGDVIKAIFPKAKEFKDDNYFVRTVVIATESFALTFGEDFYNAKFER